VLALIRDIAARRQAISELAKRDFEQQFRGSYLGFIWAFLQPLTLVGMLYVIFELGFRAGISGSIPFAVYLISGMVSWVFFAGNLGASAGVFRTYAFLIKKVNFRLSVLPVVKLLSSLPVHIALVLSAIALAWVEGYPPSLYTFQLVYYFIGMCVLLVGIYFLAASTSIFVKDVTNFVAVTAQFGFWLTPIFWNINMLPERYHYLVKLNPMYYVVTGYRESIALHVPFWHKPFEALYFWSLSLMVLVLGITVYRRLKPHFAEVL
jgi:lipopolysaccharide transport system permease protein/teichoic acid transport system permease protein